MATKTASKSTRTTKRRATTQKKAPEPIMGGIVPVYRLDDVSSTNNMRIVVACPRCKTSMRTNISRNYESISERHRWHKCANDECKNAIRTIERMP